MPDLVTATQTVPPIGASEPSGTHAPLTKTWIRPSGRWPRVDVAELWHYRGLFFFLVWRDVKVRYSQTVLGAGWAILQPLMTTVVFTVIFGMLANIPSDGLPYPVFSLAGLVPWTYFSTALAASSNSLVANSNLITKVYFPRLVVPFASVLASLVDFAIGFVMLLVVMALYGIFPSAESLLVLPVVIVAMMLVAGGVGCWLAALNVQYRDVKYVVPFMVQVWMYVSPIVYPLSQVKDERLRLLFALNPMTGVVEAFRAVLLGSTSVSYGLIAFSLGMGVLLFVTGALYFRRTERVFADVA